MSRKKRRSVSMLSLLDILCNGMGACVLLFLILGAIEDVQLAGATPTRTVIFYIAHFDPTDTIMLRIKTGEGEGITPEFIPLGTRLTEAKGKPDKTREHQPPTPCTQGNRNAPTRHLPTIKGSVSVFEYSCGKTGSFDAKPEFTAVGTFHSERMINVAVPPNTQVRFALLLAQHGDDDQSGWKAADTLTYWKYQYGEKWQQLPDKPKVGYYTPDLCLINKGGRVESCEASPPKDGT